MTAGHETYDGDALMAAITGEGLPPKAREDAAFLAEHRSAVADVALLREQLGIIAAALQEPPPVAEPAPVRTPRPRRRPFTLAVRTVGVAVAAVLASGLGWLVVQAGSGIGAGSADSGAGSKSAADSNASQAAPGYLACARLVVEGTITAIEPLPGEPGRERVTLRVTRYYKPDRGKDVLTFVRDEETAPPVRKGDHILIGIQRRATAPDLWAVGNREIADERAWLTGAVTESPAPACDGYTGG
ncbi:hypothetical protein F7R91_16080 [Streptomyces luteolifulvus]|jgi:hypothetical protein|uniref:Uncharacterized protein n=1 Tax=Streptomyces luteolifulvus TaxID=2615112 RepID=A0A6H9V2K9_9ACTN|nr:hypothetical protein [Streptomyces luteolifulvus]KAB1146428.1 hypothetical protein F7R91_16080 [Streptomyces luteolifulvus]